MLSCAEADLKLDDYVDGELDQATRQELERHLAECQACHEQQRALRALLAQAAALPDELQPERDLWPGIAARLVRPRVVLFAPARRGTGFGSLLALAAAAAALVAVLLPRGDGEHGPGAAPASTDATLQPASLGSANSLGAAQTEYERATRQLLQALQAEGRPLPPETLERLQQNLATIDKALGDIRAALDEDPQNPQLTRLLNSTHRRRLTVLQQAVRLSRT